MHCASVHAAGLPGCAESSAGGLTNAVAAPAAAASILLLLSELSNVLLPDTHPTVVAAAAVAELLIARAKTGWSDTLRAARGAASTLPALLLPCWSMRRTNSVVLFIFSFLGGCQFGEISHKKPPSSSLCSLPRVCACWFRKHAV